MPVRNSNGGTSWSTILAAAAVLVAIGVPSINALTGGTEKLEKRVAKIEEDLTYRLVTRDLLAKDINFIDKALTELKVSKVDKDVYEQKQATVDRQISLNRDAVREVDKSLNQTFSAKDALVTLQNRIVELERQIRSSSGK